MSPNVRGPLLLQRPAVETQLLKPEEICVKLSVPPRLRRPPPNLQEVSAPVDATVTPVTPPRSKNLWTKLKRLSVAEPDSPHSSGPSTPILPKTPGHLLVESCYSISVRNLRSVLEATFADMHTREVDGCGIDMFTSEDLKIYLKKASIFLPEKHMPLFSDDFPEVVVTYMWLGGPLLELVGILQENFGEDVLVWLDIVFNDQRSDLAVSRAVRSAYKIYMTAKKHVVIFARATYCVYDAEGEIVGLKECEPWDRCWCLLEMAVRDLAVQKRDKEPSRIVISGRYLDGLMKLLPPGGEADALHTMFAQRDFLAMQGRPEDVKEISALLVSPDLFSSAEEFNRHTRAKLTSLLLERVLEVRAARGPLGRQGLQLAAISTPSINMEAFSMSGHSSSAGCCSCVAQ